MIVRYRLFVLFLLLFAACMNSNDEGIMLSTKTFNFSEEEYGWEHGFADYPAGEKDSLFYELKYAYTELPEAFSGTKGIMLSGNNHSDHLFMFLKKKLTGLQPNSAYNIAFNVEFASNATVGSAGTTG